MNDERAQLGSAALLLKDAAILYASYGAGRPEPFNVFAVLRSESDEVNLHSRFLAALLGHRSEEEAANLRDFMGCVKKVASGPLRDFALKGVKVERERDYIDILITNDCGQALAIENKIYAGDQEGQLKRYHKNLVKQGYKKEAIHILYLAIDGRNPSKDSVKCLSDEAYTSISYGAILPWLERCRKRAHGEPELRESIAQYLRLIKRMTGNDRRSELMKELKKILLLDNNLLVAHNLAEALPYAKASLMHEMWEKIRKVLEEHSFTSPVKEYKGIPYSDISEDRIVDAIEHTGWFGLYYSFGQKHALLGVEAARGYGFVVGVYCKKDENEEKYDAIRKRLENKLGEKEKPDNGWPWWCVLRRDGTGLQPDDIKILADKKEREKLTGCIAESAVKKLKEIESHLR